MQQMKTSTVPMPLHLPFSDGSALITLLCAVTGPQFKRYAEHRKNTIEKMMQVLRSCCAAFPSTLLFLSLTLSSSRLMLGTSPPLSFSFVHLFCRKRWLSCAKRPLPLPHAPTNGAVAPVAPRAPIDHPLLPLVPTAPITCPLPPLALRLPPLRTNQHRTLRRMLSGSGNSRPNARSEKALNRARGSVTRHRLVGAIFAPCAARSTPPPPLSPTPPVLPNTYSAPLPM
jgi:hypothetical protein